jgi:hypothetical protein
MPRLHSETLLPPIRAAFSNARSSSGVTRTRRNFPLDDPFGSFGLPGFRFASVAFGTALVLLKDYGLQSRAALPDANTQPHDGIAVNANYALD